MQKLEIWPENQEEHKADCRDKAQWDMLAVPECREVRKENYMSLGLPSETASENKIIHTHTNPLDPHESQPIKPSQTQEAPFLQEEGQTLYVAIRDLQ